MNTYQICARQCAERKGTVVNKKKMLSSRSLQSYKVTKNWYTLHAILNICTSKCTNILQKKKVSISIKRKAS